MANKISVIIDVAVDKANQSLGTFKKSIQDAEGAVGKSKAVIGGAFDTIKANAGTLAMAGGAALFAFGAKAVDEFQKVALQAGRLSDALGLPVDAVSRLIEVAGDVGVPVDAVEKSIGKMNLEAGKSPKAFDDIGAAIARNKDGTMNVEETFLNVVDALNSMPDAGQKAAYAQKIFGKGWRDMAELIGLGSDEIVTAMGEVSDAQAISPEEVRKARDFRDSMENLKDSMGKVALSVGGAVVPAIALAVDWAVKLVDALEFISEWGDKPMNLPGVDQEDIDSWENLKRTQQDAALGIEAAQDAFRKGGKAVDEYAESARYADKDVGTLTNTFDNAATVIEETGDEYKWWAQDMRTESQKTADELTGDWDRITGKISEEQAFLQAKGEFQKLRDAAVTAWEDGEAGVDDYRLAQLDAQRGVADYIREVGNIPPQKATEILALIDQNRLDEAEALLDNLTSDRYVNLYLNTGTIRGGDLGPMIKGKRAAGGPVSAGGAYLVGENGPELLQMGSQSGNVIPNGAIGGATTVNVTVNGADPNMVVAAIRKYVRTNGPIQGIT